MIKEYEDKNIIKNKKGLTTEIIIRWCIDDVLNQAKSIGITLTKEEASEVLNGIYYDHDCTVGINWDVIDTHIEEIYAERKEK